MALFLEDFEMDTEEEVRQHISDSYEASREEVDKYEILIAYESVGMYGCDSSSFFLFRDKQTGKLYENHGAHCSCYGFEGQFDPEETTSKYLQSEHFAFYGGGYDAEEQQNRRKIIDYIMTLEEDE
ncbi:hypothetical protein [Salibacterium aidingense]|uniref:hypothetical protein n=1 Tax=Salibacterium aidingense TaxID=384933 RepID=UPI003BE0A737